jgi:hypothetical protein
MPAISARNGGRVKWIQQGNTLIKTPIPGHTETFHEAVPDGNLGDFDDRWAWTEDSMVPAFESLLKDSADQVQGDIQALVEQGREAFGPIRSPY